MCNVKDGHKHAMIWPGLFSLVGLAFVFKDLGYVSFNLTLWPVLILLLGLVWLSSSGCGCFGCNEKK